MKNTRSISLVTAAVVCVGAATWAWADKLSEEPAKKKPAEQSVTTTDSEGKPADIKAKPLTDEIRKGLKHLASTQNKDGGWGQGGGWRINSGGGGRVEGEKAEDRSDVGNTCMTMLTFLRAGEKLNKGEHAEGLRKGAAFIMKAVEESDSKDLYVTNVRDTQMQSKIGSYVDTFLALQLLNELKGQMANEAGEKQRAKLVDKIIAKIEKNQQDNGAFAGNGGWASVLSQGICSRALNTARIQGAKVSDEVLEMDNKQNLAGLDIEKKSFSGKVAAGAPSTAGVQLYANSSKLRGMQENWIVNRRRAQSFNETLNAPDASKEDKEQAREELKKIEEADKAQEAAVAAVANDVKDDGFIAGFGNNGGEEFLSYMNISESLRIKGGEDWTNWDNKITATINNAQNEDGSWSGHHCITGRNFCTAGALLTLMADRAPLPEIKDPIAAK